MSPPILLLHGALGSAAQFDPLLPLLDSGTRIQTLTFPGHGGKPVPPAFSIDLFVRATVASLDDQGIDQADILGYSMGGYVALQLARDHPGRVRRIITIGTKFQWDPESAAREVRMMDPGLIAEKVPAFADLLAARHSPSNWELVMRRTAEMMTRLGAGEAMSTADLAGIQHPVLVCRGDQDHMVHEAESTGTAGTLPNGHYRSLQDIKHPLESIPPYLLAGLCREWFNRPTPG